MLVLLGPASSMFWYLYRGYRGPVDEPSLQNKSWTSFSISAIDALKVCWSYSNSEIYIFAIKILVAKTVPFWLRLDFLFRIGSTVSNLHNKLDSLEFCPIWASAQLASSCLRHTPPDCHCALWGGRFSTTGNWSERRVLAARNSSARCSLFGTCIRQLRCPNINKKIINFQAYF